MSLVKIIPLGVPKFVECVISASRSYGFDHIDIRNMKSGMFGLLSSMGRCVNMDDPSILPSTWLDLIDLFYVGRVVVTSDDKNTFDDCVVRGYHVIRLTHKDYMNRNCDRISDYVHRIFIDGQLHDRDFQQDGFVWNEVKKCIGDIVFYEKFKLGRKMMFKRDERKTSEEAFDFVKEVTNNWKKRKIDHAEHP